MIGWSGCLHKDLTPLLLDLLENGVSWGEESGSGSVIGGKLRFRQ